MTGCVAECSMRERNTGSGAGTSNENGRPGEEACAVGIRNTKSITDIYTYSRAAVRSERMKRESESCG